MPTLTEYRQFAAKEAGRFVTGTSTTGGTTTTMVVTSLISSLSQDNLYSDWWLYLPTASAGDKVRVVASSTASTGTITVDRVFSGATVANSKTFELHGMARPFADDLTETMDWTQLINDGLKRCFLPVEFTITPTANQNRHSLTGSQSWLTNENWVREVGYLVSGEDRNNVDPYGNRRIFGKPEKLSNLVYAVHRGRTFGTNETIYVRAIKPAYYHCRATGGTFGEQSGLALEADEAEVQIEWAAYAALTEMARRAGVVVAQEAKDRIRDNERRWASLFSYYDRLHSRSLPDMKMYEPLMVGVVGGQSRWRR